MENIKFNNKVELRAYCLKKAMECCKENGPSYVLEAASMFETYIKGKAKLPEWSAPMDDVADFLKGVMGNIQALTEAQLKEDREWKSVISRFPSSRVKEK